MKITNTKIYERTENRDFIESVKYYIESICTGNRQDILRYLNEKLDEKSLAEFNKITQYLAILKVAKITKNILWKKADSKVRKVDLKIVPREEVPKDITLMPISILNDFITQPAEKEFDDYYSFVKTEKEAKELYKTYIENLDKSWLLQVLTKFLMGYSVYKANENYNRLVLLHNSWLNETKQTLVNIKYKNKPEQAKELLKIILGNKVDNFDDYIREEENEINRFGHRLAGRLSINLDSELDMQKMIVGDYFIETLKLTYDDFPQIIDEYSKAIHITLNNKSEKLSVNEYYNLRKIYINKEFLKSKDLLDNIVIIFAIKLAQNGNEEAVNILFNCYKDTAEKIAVNFLKKKKDLLKGGQDFNEGGNLNDDEIKSVASMILRLLISGDSPYQLLRNLKNVSDKDKVGLLLNRKTYGILMEVFNEGLVRLNMLIQGIGKTDEHFKKQLKNLKSRCGKSVNQDTINYYNFRIFNLCLKQMHDIEFGIQTSAISTDILNMSQYSEKFNKLVYKPTKKYTLTNHLVGGISTEGKRFQGMIWKQLNDWYRGETISKNGKRIAKDSDYFASTDLDFSDIDIKDSNNESADFWDDEGNEIPAES